MSHAWIDCPTCYIHYAIPEAMNKRANAEKDQMKVYCPNGHTWWYSGEREVDIERRKRQQLEQQNARLAEEARDAIKARNATTTMLTRERKRQRAGLCPCCNRTFVNMQRHMKTKHPDHNVIPLQAKP